MKNSKLVMLLVGQTKAIQLDREYNRSVGAAIVAELSMIPEDVVPDDVCSAAHWALEYVLYGVNARDKPEWFDSEWIGDDW